MPGQEIFSVLPLGGVLAIDDNIIQVKRENRIAVVTFNRPERLKAIKREMIRALTAFLEGPGED